MDFFWFFFCIEQYIVICIKKYPKKIHNIKKSLLKLIIQKHIILYKQIILYFTYGDAKR